MADAATTNRELVARSGACIGQLPVFWCSIVDYWRAFQISRLTPSRQMGTVYESLPFLKSRREIPG
jgi:hypothetical protein